MTEIQFKIRYLNFIFECINSSDYLVCSVTQQVLAVPSTKCMVQEILLTVRNFLGISASVPRFGYVFDY